MGMKKAITLLALLMGLGAGTLTAYGAGAVQLDQSLGDIYITGDTARVGDTSYTGSSFVIQGEAGGHTLWIDKATVPITIQSDVDTGGKPVVSTSSVGIRDGVHLEAPYITHSASGGVPATQYPVWFSGLEPGSSYQVSVEDTLDPGRKSGGAYTTKTTDVHGSLSFWRRSGEELSVVVKGNGALYYGSMEVSKGQTNLQNLSVIPFAGGTGSPEDPYRIQEQGTMDQNPFRLAPDCAFRLEADLNWSGWTLCPEFGGTFDGNQHTLNLSISSGTSDAPFGLFSTLLPQGRVENLRLSGQVEVSGSGTVLGSVAGVNQGTISNCFASTQVSGPNVVGGIAGENQGSITNCGFIGTIQQGISCGGICAFNQAQLRGCYSAGTITGTYAGGICAGNNQPIQDCYSSADITGAQWAGGILAMQNQGGSLERCYAVGTVTGGSLGGGIIGSLNGGSVTGCLAMNPAVWGKEAARIAGRGSSGLENNLAYEFTYVNGQFPPESGAGHQLPQGRSISRAALNTPEGFREAGFGQREAWDIYSGGMPLLLRTLPSGEKEPLAWQSVGYPYHLLQVSQGQQETSEAAPGQVSIPSGISPYWKGLLSQIQNAQDSLTLKVSSQGQPYMPVYLLKSIQNRDVTLEVTHNRQTVTISGRQMYPIPQNQVYYTWDALMELYAVPPEPEHIQTPADGAPPQAPQQPQLPLPVEETPPPTWQVSL